VRTLPLGSIALAGVLCLPPFPARGEEKPPPPPVHIEMKEVEIHGEVERPDVFYIIPRKQAKMDLAPLSKDYREEINEPLLPGPFEEWVRSTGATQPAR